MKPKTLAERLYSKIDKSAGPESCWPWTGARGGTGTCMVVSKRRSFVARRVLWELERGPIPPEHVTTDTCGDNGCMNLAHLRLQSRNLVDVFWSRVEKTDGCWLWKGYKNKRGYGDLFHHKKHYPVHRLSYEIHHGPIPTDEEWCVCHHCDDPGCVKPEHLFLGKDIDNMRDMWSKGRSGPQRAAATGKPWVIGGGLKYTDERRAEIRAMRAKGTPIKAIATTFGMPLQSVYNICRHVTVEQTGGHSRG